MDRALIDWWNDKCIEVMDLINEFTFENNNSGNTANDSLKDKVFVITGSLTHFKNREELVKSIESNAGKVSGSISSKTSYLINNDISSNSSKNVKAKKLGVPIISEENYIKMIL